MDNPVRIRINLSTKEFEVEGPEQFVKEYSDIIENMLLALSSPKVSVEERAVLTDDLNLQPATEKNEIPELFGEYFHLFPKDITDVERILIAGYFIQLKSEDKSFKTKEANELLLEQGIKVSNPADCVAKNKKVKRVYNLKTGIFKVSQTGIEHINNLLEKSR
jgi:hypothetical protein